MLSLHIRDTYSLHGKINVENANNPGGHVKKIIEYVLVGIAIISMFALVIQFSIWQWYTTWEQSNYFRHNPIAGIIDLIAFLCGPTVLPCVVGIGFGMGMLKLISDDL